jgi:protein TonB
MKKILLILFLLQGCLAFGQDTTYYDRDGVSVKTYKGAYFYNINRADQPDTSRENSRSYYLSGQIKLEMIYTDYKNKKITGKAKEYFESGQLKEEIDYKDGKMNGTLMTYWANGKTKRKEHYENDSLIEGKCFNHAGKDTSYYNYVDLPDYPGGDNGLMNYLKTSIVYPQVAKEAGIQGTVYVAFIITKTGQVKGVRLLRGIGGGCDEEAIRVTANMSDWKPGKHDGELAYFEFNLPVKFMLQ